VTRRYSTLAAIWSAVIAVIAVGGATIAAQTHAEESAKPAVRSKLPRTRDGHPDLQGTWTNGTLTPLERPAGMENKPLLTEEEAAALERQAAGRRANPASRPGDIGGDNEAFVDTGYKVVSTRQSSLVVDPPDGRIPLRPEAEQKRDFNLKSLDTFESMSPWDRCITRGPTALWPAAYNNGYQIVQTPAAVEIMAEEIHEARVVPLDGHQHLDSRFRFWTGDSRGRWEGDTFVVDTTNFNDKGWLTTYAGSGRLRGVPHSERLHIVERFKMTDPNTIIYEARIDDPAAFTSAWTFSIPLVRDDGYQIFEYACHEGNRAIELMLGGARTDEKKTAEAAKKK